MTGRSSGRRAHVAGSGRERRAAPHGAAPRIQPERGTGGRVRGTRSPPPGTGSSNGERGSVTVETAVALSAIMVVLAMCLAGLACRATALRVTDAAGEAARLAARGDQVAARQVVQLLAPAGSVLSLSGTDLVTAKVTAPPLGGVLPGIRVGATAVAAREPGGEHP